MKHTYKLLSRLRFGVMFILIVTTFSFCTDDNDPDPVPTALDEKSDVANDWIALQVKLLLERNTSMNSVHFGHMGVGLYEAVRNGIPGAKSLQTIIPGMPAMPAISSGQKYYWPESANAAMADLLRKMNTGLTAANNATIDSLENAYNAKFQSLTGDAAIFDKSKAYGKSVAQAIHDWLKTDNANLSNSGYVPPVGPGLWQPTPPALANGALPYLGTATTFFAGHSTLVSAAPPHPYSEESSSEFYKMVKEVYDVNLALTQDQKNTANYWIDAGNGVGLTQGGHDFNIVRQALQQQSANLGLAAEAYAKAGMAERDAFIVTFRSKYKYNQVRPVTYIQKLIKNDWLPFITTPAHPEFPAGHALVTSAVMTAAAKVIGESIPVTDKSYEFRSWPARTYPSLVAAGEESGISRLYGGIHYKSAIDEGLKVGKTLGANIGNISLK